MPQEEAEPMLLVDNGIRGVSPHLEGLRKTKLGQGRMSIWVFITGITNEFILGQDVLHTYDASVALQ